MAESSHLIIQRNRRAPFLFAQLNRLLLPIEPQGYTAVSTDLAVKSDIYP